MKAKICIYNDDSYFSDEVFIISEMPGIPPLWASVYLSESDQEKLIGMICKDHETALMYSIYYGKHRSSASEGSSKFNKIPLQELKECADLSDFHFVKGIAFEWTGTEYQLTICLSDSLNED